MLNTSEHYKAIFVTFTYCHRQIIHRLVLDHTLSSAPINGGTIV